MGLRTLLLLSFSWLSASAAAACESEQHQQFDFWLGKWNVYVKDQLAGTNQISKILGGCVLKEEWRGANGNSVGKSFNTFDTASNQWHQTWVDNQNTLLLLDGHWDGEKMLLSGKLKGQKHQISWQPLSNGTVIQHWQVYDQEQWKTLFLGEYRKVVQE